jgi:hypothetical protein
MAISTITSTNITLNSGPFREPCPMIVRAIRPRSFRHYPLRMIPRIPCRS